MKRLIINATAIVFFATTITAKTDPEAVTNEDAFLFKVVGNKLSLDKVHFTIQPNGTFTGQHRGMNYSGVWYWDGNYWCRSSQVGGRFLGTDCQLIAIDGNKVSFLQEKGQANNRNTFQMN